MYLVFLSPNSNLNGKAISHLTARSITTIPIIANIALITPVPPKNIGQAILRPYFAQALLRFS